MLVRCSPASPTPGSGSLGAWLLASGVVGFSAMGIDKWRAIHHDRRIPENAFFLLAFIGGFAGIIVGEGIFRHETLKLKFAMVVPPPLERGSSCWEG